MPRARRILAAPLLVVVTIAGLISFEVRADTRVSDPSGRVFGSTTTIFAPAQVLDPADPGSRVFQAPFYEYITLGCDDVGVRGFSVYLSGLAFAHAAHPVQTDRFGGDLLIGTVAYRSPRGTVSARVGRQILFEGAGLNALMDGAHVRIRPGAAIEVSAFGGFVPMAAFDWSAHRPIFGGRLAFNPSDWGRVGLSYAQERDNDQTARSNLGVDYAFRGWSRMDLSGNVLFDLLDRPGVQEAFSALTFFPAPGWSLSADWGMYDPAGRIPRTSIFRVFTDTRYHAVGVDGAWRGSGWLSARGFFRAFVYEDASPGFQAGLRPMLTFDQGSRRHVAGLELSFLDGPSNGYVQARAFGVWQMLDRLELTLDADNYVYLEEVGGVKASHLVGANAGYEVFPGGRVQADLRTAVDLDFRYRISGMLKFTYAFLARVP